MGFCGVLPGFAFAICWGAAGGFCFLAGLGGFAFAFVFWAVGSWARGLWFALGSGLGSVLPGLGFRVQV